VQVFDTDGNFLRQFGGEGREPGQFRHATGISLDSQGHIYVGDYSVKRVQVFANDGSFIREWQIGHESAFPGTPEGITIDNEGRVYITDYALGKVEVYTPEGEFLGSFGGTRLQAPVDIAVHADGSVFVTDQTTSRVQIYATP
jgi:tripartite motif-containing protein 71